MGTTYSQTVTALGTTGFEMNRLPYLSTMQHPTMRIDACTAHRNACLPCLVAEQKVEQSGIVHG
ncbi:hypothetical protein PG993_000242 [Apiospora rasikravindrae]|uniref:Uncharacterized protein n=1 Tax=Apiospora rasikravindrae TaxID=990691 RepID=A0ABR1U817_9PEZI